MTSNKQKKFEQIAMPHMSALYGMAVKYTHNEMEAEDLVQESLFKAYNSFDSFEEGSNCRAWLFRILYNTFINSYRHKRREKCFIDRISQESTTHSASIALSSDCVLESENALNTESVMNAECQNTDNYLYTFSDEMLYAFNSISSDFKAIIILADLQDLSYKEIAEKLHIPIGTVMSRLCRARQMLKKYLNTAQPSLNCET